MLWALLLCRDWSVWLYMGRNSSAPGKRCEESYPPWRVHAPVANSSGDGRKPSSENVADVSERLRVAAAAPRATNAISYQTWCNRPLRTLLLNIHMQP